MTQIYADIIKARRLNVQGREKNSEDMIWNLMHSVYRDGMPVPDHEIAHLMIALLIAGQETLSVISSWVVLHLATEPELTEELYQEQLRVIGPPSTPLTYENIQKLTLLANVIRETLRVHSPVHSILRKAKNPLPIAGMPWIIPPSRILLATPATSAKDDNHFPDANGWHLRRWERVSDPMEQETGKKDYGYSLLSTGADNNFLPFGAGRHRCIGEQFANLQLAVVISVMARNFRFKNVEGIIGVVDTDYSVSVPFLSAVVAAKKAKVETDACPRSNRFRRLRSLRFSVGSAGRVVRAVGSCRDLFVLCDVVLV